MPGLLIVNADDLGFSRRVTDAAVRAFEAGTISSATAMVWMRDSERAAGIARERGLPVGLHLNLTVEFAAASVPRGPRERQRKLVEHFGHPGAPAAGRPGTLALGDAVRDQLERLRETYGDPTHVDGHHHVQEQPGVRQAIPASLPVRPAVCHPDAAGRRSGRPPAGPVRPSPRWAFSLEHVHPALGGVGAAALGRAQRNPLEVVTHPADDAQLGALLDEVWRELIEGLRLGSYASLEEFARP